MNETTEARIEVEAVKALIHWKSLFANEVAVGARRLAAESTERGPVTVAHYQQAAQAALRALSTAILEGGPSSDSQKAA